MVQKIYSIENLDCANCAAKIEAKLNTLPEVGAATITFTTRQLRVTAENPDALVEKLTKIARTVEPDVRILPHSSHRHHHPEGCGHDPHKGCCGHHDHQECACGHNHHDHHECACGHNHHDHHECACGHHEHHDHEPHRELSPSDGATILTGTLLFAAGLLLGTLGLSLLSAAAFVFSCLVLGLEIFRKAWKNLRTGHMLDENFLMSIASIGAFCIGEAAEAVGILLFYRIGAYFEEKAVARSRSRIMAAIDLRPETVILEDGRTVPAEDAKAGDIVMVRAGDRIPLDGTVLRGESRVDTAPITGEPVPVSVRAGDRVTSGCVNISGQLTVQVVSPLSESMVTRILNSVESAAAGKPKIDRFITRFARVYTPAVVALAALVAVVPSLFTGNWGYWVYTALSFLVMSCPCALVLSVPLAFFSGIGAASKQGILFKGGASMEALSSIKAVAMDKTGTLTRGDFRVQEVHGDVLPLAASCEAYSTHPIGISILQAAKEQGIRTEYPEKLEEIAGRGIRATVSGKEVLCGNEKLMEDYGVSIPADFTGTGTRVIVAVNGVYSGNLLIADTIKADAKAAVTQLKRMGLYTSLFTGDNGETAAAIAAETGIDETRARLLPHEKLSAMERLRSKRGAVMFVGDGINDTPVLAGADVGAAMGSGADAAMEASDVVFLHSSAAAIPEAVAIARRTKAIATQNVVFALAVKAAVMLLGLMGFASMWMAVFADSGVAMLCVLNSIRLLYRKK